MTDDASGESVDDTEQDNLPGWRTESGVYLDVEQADKLHRFGYLSDEEREELRDTGIITVESETGESVTLCPDMWMCPDSIGPLAETLGDRLGKGRLH